MKISPSKSAYLTDAYNLYYCTDRQTSSRDAGERFGVAPRSASGQSFIVSSTGSVRAAAGSPSWGMACGAFGYAGVVGDITFNYGYNLTNRTWMSSL